MDFIVKKCLKCGQIIGCCKENDLIHTGNNCNGNLEPVGISWDELSIIEDISSDDDFLNAMIDLKEKDPIEFQLKMSQFKTQVQQQESVKTQNDNTPRCPHCKSTNIKSISGLNRGASIAMWGIFSKKINKSFECKQCGYTW